jgi:thioredoxin reductase (NADPH)
MFFKEKVVGVVGGGNSALTAALYLAKVAKKVYLIVREDSFIGEVAWIEQVKEHPHIEVLFNSIVTDLAGEERLESVNILNNNKEETLNLNGLFIEIGTEPDPLLINQLDLKLDHGYIVVDGEQKTSLENLWAAGDITTGSNSFRQVITACSEGAIATHSIFTYLQKNRD